MSAYAGFGGPGGATCTRHGRERVYLYPLGHVCSECQDERQRDNARTQAIRAAERRVIEAARAWRKEPWPAITRALVEAVDALEAAERGEGGA